jgi:Uma2 family endonuclease
MTAVAEPRPKLISIDEFMVMPDSVGYELVEGVLTERKLMGALSDYIAMLIAARLVVFCQARSAGHVFGSETTYRCFDHPNTGRRADVSLIRTGRLLGERIPEGYLTIPADLAIEVISPNDLAYEVEEKVALYLRHGFGEVWVVYPNTRTIHVHAKGQPTLSLDEEQTLTGRGPLEGFSCPVRDLFPAT